MGWISNVYKQPFSQRGNADSQEAHEKMHNTSSDQRNVNQNHSDITLHTCQNGYQTLKAELLCDIAVLLLGMYLKKTKSINLKRYRHLSAHSIIYDCKTWKQSKSPSQIKNMWYTHTHTHTQWTCWHLQQPKLTWRAFAKRNKSSRERQILSDITYVWNLDK